MSEVIDQINELSKDWLAFKGRQSADISKLSERVSMMEASRDNLGLTYSSTSASNEQKQREAFGAYLKSGGKSQAAQDDFMAASSPGYQRKSISIASDAAGGIAVPEFLESRITRRLAELSPIRQLARVVQVETTPSSYRIPVSIGGTSSGWVGEATSRTETTTATFASPTFPDGEIYALPRASQWALDDWGPSLEGFLADEVAEEFARQEGSAFVSGNGTNKPKGFLANAPVTTDDGASPARATFTMEYVPLDPGASPAATMQPGALIDLLHTLRTPFWSRATWVCNRATLAVIRKFREAGTTGQFLWQPSMIAGQPQTLLGFPLLVVDAMDSIGANKLPIVIADFQALYTVLERPTKLLIDPYSTKGQTLFYFSKRVSGHPVDDYAGKAGKIATS